MGDWWSDFTGAVSNAAHWVGDEVGQAAHAVGDFAHWATTNQNGVRTNAEGDEYARTHAAEIAAANAADAAKQRAYYGTGNPTVDGVLNAVGQVGVGVSSNYGVHQGAGLPTNVLAPRDVEGQADAAIAAQGAKMPNVAMPENPSNMLVGSSSYNPLTPVQNKVGYTPVLDAQEPHTSLGLTPIDVGQPGSDSYAAGMQGAKVDSQGEKHGYTGVTDQNHTGGVDYTAAGGSTYKPPAESGVTLGQGLIAGAGVLGAGVNLVNGNKISDAETEAAKTQAKGYTDALAQNQAQFDKTQENIKPWLVAASGEDGKGGALAHLTNFDAEHPRADFTASPDYAFRLSEGLKALRNTAGAQGSLVSGETMKAASNYAGNAASQEYGNWYNRSENSRNTDRNALASLAGLGQTAVGQSNAAGQAFATNAMQGTTGMANALASGVTGAANASAYGTQAGAQTLMGSINSAIAMGQNQDQYNELRRLIEKNKAN